MQKPNVVPVVGRDIGQMIANVQCLLPDRLHQNQTRTARMATRQQPTNQANQVGVCFVLNEHRDDPDTSANILGQNVPLPTDATAQIPLTPTASAADIKNTASFNERATDDDEIWATEADHRTGWNKKAQERNVSWYAVWNCFAR